MIDEILFLIRARYPLIWVVSYEEARVEVGLRQIAADRNRHLLIWSVTGGIAKDGHPLVPDMTDPLRTLDYVASYAGDAIVVLRDFHPYMKDPQVVRRLRDLAHALKDAYKNIILLSPILEVPLELEKDVSVVDFPLPVRSELRELAERLVGGVPPDKLDFNLSDGIPEAAVDAALGLTYEEARNVYSKSLVKTKRLDVEEINSEKKQIIRKAQILEFFQPNEHLSDVGGLEQLKTWLRKRQKAFSEEARAFGLPVPRGLLLIGLPGCGKSLVAKAVGTLWQLPLLRFDVGKIFASLVGSSEENMRTAIKTAESIAPCILWLDEMEKAFAGTQSSNFSDAGTTARVFGSFVTWMQEKTAPVFVIATANQVSMLPPELMRKGRFDEIFFVDLPDARERRDIFTIHLAKRNRRPEDFDVNLLARTSDGFSGSEIEQAIISALYDAFDVNRDITPDDVRQALAETVPLSRTMEQELQAIRNWAHSRARPANLRRDSEAAPGDKLEI
jgi:SpoVK/Ycf46/Vps4 family AAA+-type ATPase